METEFMHARDTAETNHSISHLKEQLESAINERLAKFKKLATKYELMSSELESVRNQMVSIATEMKPVEYIIRMTDNTYPDLFDQLLESTTKKGKNGK